MYKNCNVVMLSTNEKTSNIVKILKDTISYTTTENISGGTYQHLYITSDEEIKEVFKGYAIAILKEDNRIKELIEVITVQEDGCNRYTSIEYQQFSFKYHSIYPIIATTDTSLGLPQPSKSFIQKYIEEYNKGNVITKVEVEYEGYVQSTTWEYDEPEEYRLKVNPDNIINIKPIKDSWSREEVIELLFKCQDEIIHPETYYEPCNGEEENIKKFKDDMEEWIEENL